MIAGTLEIQLLANMARLQADMDTAKRSVGSAMSSIESAVAMAKGALIGLGAIGLATAFAQSVRGVIDLGDELNKLSQRTGVGVEALSQLRYAAKLSDVSAESLSTGLKKLNISIAEAGSGSKEKAEMFKALGVSVTDASGRTKAADQVLLDIADTFKISKDGAEKTAAAVKLLGKSGDEMIPLLNGGSEAIRAMKNEADKLGLTISADFAKQAEEFNDNLTRIQAASQKLSISLAGELIDGLSRAMKAMADATIEGGKLYGMYKGLQTLLTGDDMHKSNVMTFEGTERLMAAESALAKAREKGDGATVTRLTNAVRLRKEELAVHQNYNKVLNAEVDANAAIAKASDAAKKTIKLPSSAGGGGSTKNPDAKFDAYLKQLQHQIDKAQQLNDVERVYADIKNGNIGKISAAQEEQLIAIATETDAIKNAQRIATERSDKRNKEYADAIQASKDMAQADQDRLHAMLDRGPEAQLERQRREMIFLTEAYEAGKISVEQYNDAATGALGLNQKTDGPLQSYFKSLQNPIEEMERATVNAYQSMEDAAVKFATTGKLDFKSMANSIIADLIRIQIRKSMSGIFSAGGGDAGGGGVLGTILGGIGSILGFADGGTPPVGRASMVGERGPELFVPQSSGTIIPNGQLGGSSATINNSYNIQIDSRADQASVYAGVQSLLAKNNKETNEQLRRAGVLA